MTPIFTRVRLLLGALALFGLVFAVAPAGAQQPTSVNPTASAVKEEQLLREQDKSAVDIDGMRLSQHSPITEDGDDQE